jgi:hypothetical protein
MIPNWDRYYSLRFHHLEYPKRKAHLPHHLLVPEDSLTNKSQWYFQHYSNRFHHSIAAPEKDSINGAVSGVQRVVIVNGPAQREEFPTPQLSRT